MEHKPDMIGDEDGNDCIAVAYAQVYGGTAEDWKTLFMDIDRVDTWGRDSVERWDAIIESATRVIELTKTAWSNVVDLLTFEGMNLLLERQGLQRLDGGTFGAILPSIALHGLRTFSVDLSTAVTVSIEQRAGMHVADYRFLIEDSNGFVRSLRKDEEAGKEDTDGSRKRSLISNDCARKWYEEIAYRVERARDAQGDAVDYLRAISEQVHTAIQVAEFEAMQAQPVPVTESVDYWRIAMEGVSQIAVSHVVSGNSIEGPRPKLPTLEEVYNVLSKAGAVVCTYAIFQSTIVGEDGTILFHGSWKDAAFLLGGLLHGGYFPDERTDGETIERFTVVAPKSHGKKISGEPLTMERCKAESWGRPRKDAGPTRLQEELTNIGFVGKPSRGRKKSNSQK
jgi:hypothetical protein